MQLLWVLEGMYKMSVEQLEDGGLKFGHVMGENNRLGRHVCNLKGK